MKLKRFSYSLLMQSFGLALLTMFGACGVEAGNPNSADDGLFRVFVSPTSYRGISSISGNVESFNFLNAEKTISKPASSSQFALSTEGVETSNDSKPTFEFRDLGQSGAVLRALEIKLAEISPYVQINSGSEPKPVRAVVLDEVGNKVNSIIFEGDTLVKSGGPTDIIIDLELRRTLSPLDPSKRISLGVPDDVTFSIRQKHRFRPTENVGLIAFKDFEPDSIVCVFLSGTSPVPSPDACTGDGYKSQIISKSGTAAIGALVPGTYRVAVIKGSQDVVSLPQVEVAAKSKVVVGWSSPASNPAP
jgi:hypothetical protein